MEKIALISDIHGNKTALNAVLEDISSRKISRIFCLGDIVSKGANPEFVIDLIKEKCEIVLKGNCDDIYSSNKAIKEKYWTTTKIGEERINYLRNLPVMYEFYLSGQLIRLFHSSPYSLEYIYNPLYIDYKNQKRDDLLKMFKNTDFIGKKDTDPIPNIVGYSHLHTPNLYRLGNKTLFNTGSVGLSNELLNDGNFFNEENKFSILASYTIIEGDFNSRKVGTISITNVRVPYDISKEIKYIENTDIPIKDRIILTLKTASTNYEGSIQ